MNYRIAIALAATLFTSAGLIQAETAPAAAATTAPAATAVAGSTVTAVTVTEFVNVVNGWSAEKAILDKKVVNEKGDKLGEVEDVIIAPDTSLSYAIVDVGGFLGMGEHRVAVPMKYFQMKDGDIVVNGATKDMLKEVPEFKYSK